MGAGVRLSMDGRGFWKDNVFIERLRRSLKDKDIYLKGYADDREAHAGIGSWFAFVPVARTRRLATARQWRSGAKKARAGLDDKAVGMALHLDNAVALPTCPKPQQQRMVA